MSFFFSHATSCRHLFAPEKLKLVSEKNELIEEDVVVDEEDFFRVGLDGRTRDQPRSIKEKKYVSKTRKKETQEMRERESE